MNRYSLGQTKALFWGFCSGDGSVALDRIFWSIRNASIARAFFVTAADFAAISLYGYTTKSGDLTGDGCFHDDGAFWA